MAKFEQPASNNFSAWDLSKEQPPAGSFIGTIIECKDEFGVTRPVFDDPSKTETYDRTSFLFGFRDKAGAPHKIATRWMKISGHEKSALYKFLKDLRGKPFAYGQDYNAPTAQGGVIGEKALITILHEQRKDGNGIFPTISSAIPVPDMFTQAPPQQAAVEAAPVEQDAPGDIPF